ncbi:unnamed protein product [Allacma fusca]|uniref:Thioredoxin domain-containing protein n=1 Tax=Allacma fusca TaxID=39272 RepID=A0A8J2K890_9HEXA|nr:unnamed protein product [Allacma fusca]
MLTSSNLKLHRKLKACYALAILCILLSVLLSVRASGVGHPAKVLELSDRFLEVRKQGIWLVKFYAPWCGHCKRLEPIYNHVAQALHDTAVRVAKVDCTRFPSVASEFSVRGFPTIIFMQGDKLEIYRGERVTDDIVNFAKKMSEPHIIHSTDDPLTLHGHLFAYEGPIVEPLWSEFETIAKENQHSDTRFYFIEKEEHQDIVSPKVLKKNSNGVILELSEGDELRNFVSANRFDHFVRLTRSNFDQLFLTKKLVAVGVIEEDKVGRSPNHHLEFRDFMGTVAADTDMRTFQVCWTSAVDLLGKFLTMQLQTPALLVINSTNHEHFLLNGNDVSWSPDTIFSHLDLVSKGGVRAYGGNSIIIRLYRKYYELTSNLVDMWAGNPILTTVLFGLPLGFLSLILYSYFCPDLIDDVSEETQDNEGEDLDNHEKCE